MWKSNFGKTAVGKARLFGWAAMTFEKNY